MAEWDCRAMGRFSAPRTARSRRGTRRGSSASTAPGVRCVLQRGSHPHSPSRCVTMPSCRKSGLACGQDHRIAANRRTSSSIHVEQGCVIDSTLVRPRAITLQRTNIENRQVASLCRTGFTPAGFLRKVSFVYGTTSSLHKLAWRTHHTRSSNRPGSAFTIAIRRMTLRNR
jgi:hypothetical protein